MLEFTYGGNQEGKKGKRDIGHEVALVEKYIKGKSGARERIKINKVIYVWSHRRWVRC